MVNANAPGRKFLKVTGILYLVFAGLALAGLLGWWYEGMLEVWDLMSFLYIGYYIFLGVMGVKHCASKEKAHTLRVLALINFGLIGIVSLGLFATAQVGVALLELLLAIPLTVLYLLGAMKNERMEDPSPTAAPVAWDPYGRVYDTPTDTSSAYGYGAPENPPVETAQQIDMDRLRDLKTLLDDGIITQEEFEAKKRELLGL